MSKEKYLYINVEEIIKTKLGKKHKRIPKFIIKYLEKILHQDENNDFLWEKKDHKDIEFAEDIIEFLQINIKYEGIENIPNSGRFIFVANHPLGGLESIALIKIISLKFVELKFVVNDFLMILTQFKNIFIPINKLGGQNRQYAEQLNDAYFSEKQILYFPAGLCSRKIKGKIVDLEWQKSFIQKAIESRRDIIPIHIDGKNSNFFYNLAKLRKFLRIKFNIEMLYLVDEMYKQRGQVITFKIGKPISYLSFNKSKSSKEWAQEIKELTYKL